LVGGIRVEPCSVGASPASLIKELSVEKPVSSIRIGFCSDGLADLDNFEVLLEACRKDSLEGLAVDFWEENFGCEGEVVDFACMPNKFQTSGRSVLPASVLKLLVR